ncbi:hypothetical protein BDZ89DRAFT_1130946 [Hymenopellis radicata]|nr:hypothetical protein BDZ89DRAFT_1130946 [Hymenopellis radicata]
MPMNVLHLLHPLTPRSKQRRIPNVRPPFDSSRIIGPQCPVPSRLSIQVETSRLSFTDYDLNVVARMRTSSEDTSDTQSLATQHTMLTDNTTSSTTVLNSFSHSVTQQSGRARYRGETATEPVDVEDVFAAIRTGWTIPTMPSAKTPIFRTRIPADDVVCVPPNVSPSQEQRMLQNLSSVSNYSLRDRYRELKPAYIPAEYRSAYSPPLIFRPPTATSDVSAHPRRPVPSDFRIPTANENRPASLKPTHSKWTCIPMAMNCRTREVRFTSTPRHFEGVPVDLSYFIHIETDTIILALLDTPVKIGIGFHGYCAKRVGDFMVGGYFTSLRGIHVFMLMQRPTSSQPSTFMGPRLLAVPREFVENPDKVLPTFDIQESQLINAEWGHVYRGRLMERFDELLNAGLGCFM